MPLSAIDLEDHWDRVVADPDGFPSFAIGARFAGVERVFELTEEAIPLFQAKAVSDAHLDLAKFSSIYSERDVDEWKQSLNRELKSTIPAAFFGSAVFMLTASHEKSLLDLSDYVMRHRKVPKQGKGDPRHRSPQARLCSLLGMSEFGDSNLSHALKNLTYVRNSLAHASGHLSSEPRDRAEYLIQLTQTQPGLSLEEGRLVVTGPFLRESLSAVVTHLNIAMEAVIRSCPLSAA